jgi:hypothetical protein
VHTYHVHILLRSPAAKPQAGLSAKGLLLLVWIHNTRIYDQALRDAEFTGPAAEPQSGLSDRAYCQALLSCRRAPLQPPRHLPHISCSTVAGEAGPTHLEPIA